MLFRDRTEAGQKLALLLRRYNHRKDVVVLGLPRGGVPVAYEIATALGAPLDVFVLRKLGVPDHEELAFGAIASGGVRVLDDEIIEAFGLSDLDIQTVTESEQRELERREALYRGGRPRLDVKDKTVILVDDGIATGSSMRAAITAIRQVKPTRVVVATPVAPVSTYMELKGEVDEVVCAEIPSNFQTVGQFYVNFSQTTDDEVIGLLNEIERPLSSKAVRY